MPSAAAADAPFAASYPRTIKARDRQLELRLMGQADVAKMVAFAKALPPDDLLFLRRNLRKLSAQMTLDQAGARATFERLGFRPEALLTDWVMDAKGRTRDLLVMAYDLDGLTDTVDA